MLFLRSIIEADISPKLSLVLLQHKFFLKLIGLKREREKYEDGKKEKKIK